jgi:hypothetical protein
MLWSSFEIMNSTVLKWSFYFFSQLARHPYQSSWHVCAHPKYRRDFSLPSRSLALRHPSNASSS